MGGNLNSRDLGRALLIGLGAVAEQISLAPGIRSSTRIFLSYAREDQQQVQELYKKLRQTGFAPWMDTEDILAGEDWELAIEKGMTEADFFVACLSSRSVGKRGILQAEIKKARALRAQMLDDDIYIIPVRLEAVQPPQGLMAHQWVDLFEQDGWARLVKAINAGMERRTKPASTEDLRETIPPVVKEALVGSLDRGEDSPVRQKLDEIVSRIEASVVEELRLDPDRLIVMASLARLIPATTMPELQRQAARIQTTPGYDNPEAIVRFWSLFLETLDQALSESGADPTRMLNDEMQQIVRNRQTIQDQWIGSIPIAPAVLAMLEIERQACQRDNAPYRSAHMLYSLLAANDSFTSQCFDSVGYGLADEIMKKLMDFVRKQLPKRETGKQYEAFDWERHETVWEAKRRALFDGYPVANEKYVLLALLSSHAETVKNLRRYVDGKLGAGVFDRIKNHAKTYNPQVGQVGRTPFMEWR